MEEPATLRRMALQRRSRCGSIHPAGAGLLVGWQVCHHALEDLETPPDMLLLFGREEASHDLGVEEPRPTLLLSTLGSLNCFAGGLQEICAHAVQHRPVDEELIARQDGPKGENRVSIEPGPCLDLSSARVRLEEPTLIASGELQTSELQLFTLAISDKRFNDAGIALDSLLEEGNRVLNRIYHRYFTCFRVVDFRLVWVIVRQFMMHFDKSYKHKGEGAGIASNPVRFLAN